MPQVLEHPTPVEKDFLPLNGTDYVSPRTTTAPLSVSAWPPIAVPKPEPATALPTSWCRIKCASS
jgi:hypothetical protein